MKPVVTDTAKEVVRAFWNEAACGEKLYLGHTNGVAYDEQAKERYRLEPYIVDFADFAAWQGKRVLEIGVGLGADHERFACAGAQLWGIDLTGRAIAHTASRLGARGLCSTLMVADAEKLPFADDSFDLVYSWGVIHHSPNTAEAAREISRVLKGGGVFRVMIYHNTLWLA